MSLTIAEANEIVMDGGIRCKLYRITHDGATTSWTIVPGEGYKYVIGDAVKCYSVSSGTYTITLGAAGVSTATTDIMFIGVH